MTQPAQCTRKVKHLIIDSNALIKGVRLDTLGDELWTVPEVLSELRDKNVRERMASLHYQIKTREPTPQALRAVTEFARKIGEYLSLSVVDRKVLALAYLFEQEVNGIGDIKLNPRVVKEVTGNDEEGAKEEQSGGEGSEESGVADGGNQDGGEEEEKGGKRGNEEKEMGECGVSEGNTKVEERTQQSSFVDDDGEGEWITPDNIAQVSARAAQEVVSQEPVSVGCITSDFAMQNALLQMGLKLVSFGGLAIQRVRCYILRCFSCYKFCRQTDKQFCPACGNNTLVKVSMSVNADGSVTYYQTQKIRLRGTMYSIPLPKGGRKNTDLIFTEDNLMERQRTVPKTKKQGNYDEFAFGARKSGPKSTVQVGYGRQNPNIARRKIGKKNKPITTM